MNYTHISATSTGANIANRGARLHSVVINTKGAATSTLTLYDNPVGDTSGTVIAVIDCTVQPTLIYEVDTLKGLSYAHANAAADITIAWQ